MIRDNEIVLFAPEPWGMNAHRSTFSPPGPRFDPATITLGLSAVGTVTGLIQGVQRDQQNASIRDQQNRDMDAARRQVETVINSVKKESYDAQANADILASMRGVSELMSTRGMGLGGSAMAATMADAAAKIRSASTQSYQQDRLQAGMSGANGYMQIAQAPRLGYHQNPYGDFGAGMTGLADWAANNPNAAIFGGRSGTGGTTAPPIPTFGPDTGPPVFSTGNLYGPRK